MANLNEPSKSLTKALQTVGKDCLTSGRTEPENKPQTLSVTERELITQTDTIKQAWKSRHISAASDKELAQTLNKVYFTIGLRPQHFPTREEDLVLFGYLRQKYGERTLGELYLAFDLAINDKLDVNDYKVYDQFSIEYLVRVFNSYGRYVYKTMTEAKQLTPPPAPVEVPKVTENEKLTDIAEFFNAPESKILPLYVYEWLDQLGFLTYTDEEKVKLYGEAIKAVKINLANEALKNTGDKGAKAELDRLRENIREGFRKATPHELSAIQTEYKKTVLIDQKNKYKQRNKTQ